MKCKPHCKYCFVLLKDMPLNQPLIHCNICNKPMKIINDKDNKESNLEDCFAKFRKGK